MPNEIYNKSWWGTPVEDGWGDSYYAYFSGSDQASDGGGDAPATPSLTFLPAASVEAGKINANTPTDEFFTFTRASTATFLGSNDLLQTAASGVPRIDYVGNSSGHILLEPSRTNVFRFSNTLSNNSWWSERNTLAALTSSDKNITSPTGTDNDAWTLTTTSGTGVTRVGMRMRNSGANNHTIDASTSKTVSIFVKKSSYDFVHLETTQFQSDMNGRSWFNISNGTLGTKDANHTSAKIEDYKNGWYRCSVTITAPASPTDNQGQFNWFVSNADTETTVPKDGTSTSFWYGGQIEVGEYATSYMETGSATVTRAADTANGAGDSTLFNDSEGVLYAEFSVFDATGDANFVGICDGTDDNRILIGKLSSNADIKAVINRTGQSTKIITSSADFSDNVKVKLAFRYKSGDNSLFLNGVNIAINPYTYVPTGLSQVNFDNGGGNNDFYGKIKEIKVYKEALTDAELATLTT